MDRGTAAELLAGSLYQRGVVEGVAFFQELLSGSPPAGAQWEGLRSFYRNLAPEQKALMDFAVQEAIRGAVWRLAVFFDGAAGYEYEGDKPFEYTLALRRFADVDAAGVDPPESVTPICPTEKGEDVHDIFLSLFDDADTLPG